MSADFIFIQRHLASLNQELSRTRKREDTGNEDVKRYFSKLNARESQKTPSAFSNFIITT